MVAAISMKAREKIPGHFIFLNTPSAILKVHEFLNDSEDVTADLKASPYSIGTGGVFVPVGSFSTTATTQQPGEDSMNIGVGFSVRCTDRVSFFADYDVRFFQQDSMAQFVSVTGTVEF